MFRTMAVLLVSLCLFAAPLATSEQTAAKLELAQNWKLAAAKDVSADGVALSQPAYDDHKWFPIQHMPATVLEILQEDDVYPDLYVGKNMLEKVPQDLYKQDWWYRTTFTVPAGYSGYTLEFPGINYRAEIWLNGQRVADSKQVVGMYAAHEFNVTAWIKLGSRNSLAIKVTPEQLIQDVNGVELADSWFDWLSWKYLGYKGENQKVYESVNLQLRFEGFNVFNIQNLGIPEYQINVVGAGRITSLESGTSPRELQFGLKLQF